MAWGVNVKLNAKSAPVLRGIGLSVCRIRLRPAMKRVLAKGVGRVVVRYDMAVSDGLEGCLL